MTVAGVLLASGQHAALSEHQQLLMWDQQETLLEHVMSQMLTWPVDERIVVLGHDADAVISAVDFEGFTIVVDFDWHLGAMSSLSAALDHLMRRTGPPAAVLVTHADQAETPLAAIDELLAAEGSLVVAPVYRYQRGYPLLIRSGFWDRLMSADVSTELLRIIETAPDVSDVRIDALPARRIDSDRALALARPDKKSEKPH
ncbi:MAG: NTP transferase domain-containing protein [Acidimicrobiia bacterium]|nr:NTP transferase domain-containing protein [Acidimicrobiia bacterium]NNC43713.1 NTP transferase domain-containing protein [Acidimicrobiia bacterium]NND14639.1 NTP transferase domain-containing protein [Acidimicrobiia bacterium]